MYANAKQTNHSWSEIHKINFMKLYFKPKIINKKNFQYFIKKTQSNAIKWKRIPIMTHFYFAKGKFNCNSNSIKLLKEAKICNFTYCIKSSNQFQESTLVIENMHSITLIFYQTNKNSLLISTTRIIKSL